MDKVDTPGRKCVHVYLNFPVKDISVQYVIQRFPLQAREEDVDEKDI